MENDDKKWADASPWHPIRDQRLLKFLGKLGEEVCELGTAIFRCVIQGVDEAEPVTGKINRAWLQDEVGDVYANLALVVEELGLDRTAIRLRKERKMDHLRGWHAYAEEPPRAWEYEIATVITRGNIVRNGVQQGANCYSGWEPRLSREEPTATDGSIRNIRALR